MRPPESGSPAAANDGAKENRSGTATTTTVTPAGRDSSNGFPARIRVSRQADEYLDRLAAAIMRGEVGLHQLSGGLLAVVCAVDLCRQDDLAAMTARVARLEYERDLWYFVAHNPGKKPGDYYAATTAELWRQGGAA